jgi:hypothetical protein
MVRAASLFSQLVGLFDRRKFNELVIEHRAERMIHLSPGYSGSSSESDQHDRGLLGRIVYLFELHGGSVNRPGYSGGSVI